MAKAPSVSDILEAISEGEKTSKADLEILGEAAASLRSDFLRDALRATQNLTPRTADFEAFKKCFSSMSDFMLKHGFVTVNEIQVVWMRIEEVER